MKVIKWKDKQIGDSGITVQINSEEAYTLMRSLSSQLEAHNPNTGRSEVRDDKGKYFSIAITDLKG